MKTLNLILLIFVASLILSGCSKPAGKTEAKLQLKLSGIVNLSSGIGSGGAILYGKNTLGDSFGKKINNTEENIVLPNGSWTFYAFMWGSESTAMDGKVYCGKSSNQLSGSDATISMSLTNANCTDAEFSNGRTYVSSGVNHFADLFIEECDEVNAATGFGCGLDNQGSALSYRLKFQSFNKSAAGAMAFSSDVITSVCKKVDILEGSPTLDIYKSGFPVNFPSGNGATPFVVSMELFVGTQNCDTSDPKGVHQVVLNQGLGAPAADNDKVSVSSLSCPGLNTPDFTTGTELEKENKCNAAFGTWSASNCSGINSALGVVMRFVPSGACSAQTPGNVAIKHQVAIPKPFLCDKYLDKPNIIGAHPFAGGIGTKERPYKICTEWQLNQIGEANAVNTVFNSKNFKLMNDLDMNKTDFNPALKPSCVGATNSIYKKHANMNPLDQLTVGGCDVGSINPAPGFSGTFNGNYKTIRHARLEYEGVDILGFVRSLNSGGVIKNLNFYNLSVRGNSSVGGVAGNVPSFATIKNINIERGEIEGKAALVGGIVGSTGGGNFTNIRVNNVNVHGATNVGGLIGSNSGTIDSSMYRGELRADSGSAVGNIGGIAGLTSSGSIITKTFSEGSINSYLQNTGGIVGSNAGTITNAYSNMYILSYYGPTNAAAVGGIVGANTSSNISYVYSDSILDYKGGYGGSIVDGINAGGTAISNTTLCLSTASTTHSLCTSKTYATLRDGATNFPSLPASWKSDVPGALPRLAWESDTLSRPCLLATNLASVAAQTAAGRGTAANPLMICTLSQFTGLSNSSLYSNLGEDLNISALTSAVLIPNYSGNLNGNKYSLYGLNINSTTPGAHGLFVTNTGTIRDLNLMGNVMIHTNASGSTGLLVGENSGILRNITVLGNVVEGVNNVGGIAGTSSGTIEASLVGNTNVRGATYVGGVTGQNAGVIRRVSSNAAINEISGYPIFAKFGGVTAVNNLGATIDQAMFSGFIQFNNISDNTTGVSANIFTGGIAGSNAGVIKNAMTRNYARIDVKNYGSVGGLIGDNTSTGIVQTSFALGSVKFNVGAIPVSQPFGALVGNNTGNIDSTNTFFLENHAGALIGTPSAAAACSAGMLTFSGNPSYLTSGSIMADLVSPASDSFNNGDTLTTYFYFSPPAASYVINYAGNCAASDLFNLFKSYEQPATAINKKTIADFSDVNQFNGYNMAIDTGDPMTSIKYNEMIEYYKSDMYGTPIPAGTPTWSFEQGDKYPQLLQIKN